MCGVCYSSRCAYIMWLLIMLNSNVNVIMSVWEPECWVCVYTNCEYIMLCRWCVVCSLLCLYLMLYTEVMLYLMLVCILVHLSLYKITFTDLNIPTNINIQYRTTDAPNQQTQTRYTITSLRKTLQSNVFRSEVMVYLV